MSQVKTSVGIKVEARKVLIPNIKRKLKSFFLELLNIPIDQSNEHVVRGWTTVSRSLVAQYKKVALLICISAVAAIFEGATMALLGLAISTFVHGDSSWITRIPESFQSNTKSFVESFSRDVFFLVLVIAAVIAQILKSVFLTASEWIQIRITYGLRLKLQKKLTAHIMGMNYGEISTYPAGRLATLIDQSKLVMDIAIQLGNIVRASLMGIAYFAVMFFMSIYMTLTIMVAVAILWFLISWVIGFIRHLADKATKSELEVWRWTIEYLNAPRLLRIFNTTDYARKAIDESWEKQLQPECKADIISAIIPKALEMITVAGAGLFLITVFLVTTENKQAVISSLFVYVLIFFRLRPVIKSFSDFNTRIARITPRLEVIGSLLARPSKLVPDSGLKNFSGLQSGIEFSNVSFCYPTSNIKVVDDISFTIPRGETVALIGSSGAGKSTIADLLLGLFSPTSGKILVDGVDLCEFEGATWRDKIGVVDQEAFLLNTSVIENIQFSRPYVAENQITAVAQSAHAHDFIKELDQGYNTVIGDRGLRLSGGQQQRLALARALFRNPEILVLDEATSALDTQSERIIQSTLEKMHSSRTILIIAHRLSTIVGADKIVVVEDGKIVEQGARNELLALDGRFANLWKLQDSVSSDKLS